MGRDILFNFPQAGMLILLTLPFFIGQFLLSRYRKKMQFAYAPSSVLSRLLTARSPTLRYTKIVGWGIIWSLASLALMEPFGNIRYSSLSTSSPSAVQPYATPHEIIFLVDTSASMRVPDGYNGQTRLETAKVIMEDILRQLHGQTVSLYAFTSELSSVVPSTLDYIFTRLAINDLHIDEGDVGGTLFAPILTSLKQQAFPEPSDKRTTIFMFSDGGDTQLEALTGNEREKKSEAILNAIPNPEQLHVRLFTIGIGSLKAQAIPNVSFEGKPVESKLEPEILQSLAEHERGKYYMAEKWTSWNLAQDLMEQSNKNFQPTSSGTHAERKVAPIHKEDVIVDLYYQIPLGLALLFYFLNLLLPDVRRL